MQVEHFAGCTSMLKLQVRRWSERPRIMVLMLAVMLPAAALIVFGMGYLRHIQRDKAIEAAFQRDYQQVLAIAEKRIDERAYEGAEGTRSRFPDADNPEELDTFMAKHPHIAHAFLWTGKGKFAFRSQPSRLSDPRYCAEDGKLSSDLGAWWDIEGKDFIAKLKRIQAEEGRHVYFTSHWITRNDKMVFQSLALFLPRGSTPERPALA